MQITFNTPQEQKDWQDFCERLSFFICEHIDDTAIELLREMQERGMTFE